MVTFCSDGTQGSTRGYNTEVYFCEAGLDINTILGSNYAITAGQPLPDTTSPIWVHELVHVNMPCKHFVAPGPSNSAKLVPVIDLETARTDTNGVILRSGKAYAFSDIANLARLVPDDAVDTAD